MKPSKLSKSLKFAGIAMVFSDDRQIDIGNYYADWHTTYLLPWDDADESLVAQCLENTEIIRIKRSYKLS